MLSKFSWHEYWCFIVIAAGCYYAALAIYYRSEIISRITGRKDPKTYSNQVRNYVPQNVPEAEPDEDDEHFVQNDTAEEQPDRDASETMEEPAEEAGLNEPDNEKILELIDNVSNTVSTILSEHTANTGKEELLQHIGHAISIITRYEDIKDFREAIDWHIERQALLMCGLTLTSREIQQVWNIIK